MATRRASGPPAQLRGGAQDAAQRCIRL